MHRTFVLPALVCLLGLILSAFLVFGLLGTETDEIEKLVPVFAQVAAALALFPTILAAAPARHALPMLGLAALLCGIWVWDASGVTSDGGMSFAITAIMSCVLLGYALLVVILRYQLIDKKRS